MVGGVGRRTGLTEVRVKRGNGGSGVGGRGRGGK